MDFVEQLQSLATKTEKLCSLLQTEEATKNALIMPFINLLGYDIFDPTEVIPKRMSLGLKQSELVEMLNVSSNTVSRYETGLLDVPKVVEPEWMRSPPKSRKKTQQKQPNSFFAVLPSNQGD
jgi:DNA-binding transcriptional regulator YiaG